MPYVNERWLGGMLTNFETMSKRVNKMLEYERMQASGEFDVMLKKEALLLERELTKLQRNLGGLRNLKKAPDAIFVLDTKKEHIAVTEANKLGIPVVAVVDTNVDPEVVQYPIPGNDDAIRSNGLFARVIADAVEEGRFIANRRNPAPAPVAERTPEEEAEFAAAQAAARDAAAQAQAERDARLAAAKTAPVADAPAVDAPAVEADDQPAVEIAAEVTDQVADVATDDTTEPSTES
jgi:small subunit ribosomal protein S2